jgi:hypothetical protein
MGRLASLLARLRWTILIVLVVACQKGQLPLLPDAGVIEPVTIKSSSDTVAIPPFGSRQLVFYLWGAQGEPVPDTVMNFEILDKQKTPGSGGARLSLSSGLTDEQGAVTLQIIAGTGSDDQKPLVFSVRASAGKRAKELPVFVTSGALASAEIEPRAEGGNADIASFALRFYDDTVCADVSWDHQAPSIREEQTFPPSQGSYVFSDVVTSGVHAVLALARGASNLVLARGCADLPGNALTPSQVMRVSLPLTRTHVSPVGTYQVQAKFELSQPEIASIRDEWKTLSSRTCDPASLWLDCTIDALSGDSNEDPLDCRPMAGGEGDLGTFLSAKRSVPGAGRGCASQVDISGKTSLDAKVYALFPSSFLSLLSLSSLPGEVIPGRAELALSSTLTVAESGLADVLNIEHRLDTLTLSRATLSAEELGLPVRDVWFASHQSGTGQLELSSHGFTLHLGSLARQVYYKTSLKSQRGMADVDAFLTTLFNGAGRNTRSTILQGCDALDSLLCEEASAERGCLKSACQAGLEKLARRLDASFAVLDGPGLDFTLSGAAGLVDSDGDNRAESLRNSFITASFHAQSTTTVFGTWSAVRISPSSP